MQITYSKLKSGQWGVRVKLEDPFEELPAAGAEVTVEKKNGTKDAKTLGQQIWAGEDEFPLAFYALD